jgi:hypothetical protein
MYRLFDLTFLEVLDQKPAEFREIMYQLFKEAGHRTMFNFLNEKAKPSEILKVMRTVPTLPFTKALLKNLAYR